MSRTKSGFASLVALAASACTLAPPVDGGSAAEAARQAAPAAARAFAPEATRGPEQATETPTAGTPSGRGARAATPAGAGEQAQVEPDLVIDARTQYEGSTVKCREMLRPASNVIETKCLTLDDWKIYERQEAEAAERWLRALRGEL